MKNVATRIIAIAIFLVVVIGVLLTINWLGNWLGEIEAKKRASRMEAEMAQIYTGQAYLVGQWLAGKTEDERRAFCGPHEFSTAEMTFGGKTVYFTCTSERWCGIEVVSVGIYSRANGDTSFGKGDDPMASISFRPGEKPCTPGS